MGKEDEISQGRASTVPLLEDSRESQGNGGGGGATSAQTLGNIVLSILGTGVLGLPYAFRVAGWLAGSLGVAAAAISIYYCMLLLVQCRKRLEELGEEGSEEIQTYGDVGEKAFGRAGRYLSEILIVISYTGGAIAYLLFIGQNLSSVFSYQHGRRTSPSEIVFFLLLPIELALSFIRSLKLLAPFSVFADVCNVLALAFVIKEDVQQLGSSYGPRRAFNGLWSLPFAGGVAVFCFEGLGMTLALERSMAKPQKFPWVLLLVFLMISVAYACFGVFGYLAYGEGTLDIITLNLPNNWSATVVKVGLCIAITFTIPITVHPVYEILEGKLKSSGLLQKFCQSSHCNDWLGLQVVRVLLVVASTMLAALIPGFAALISFMGGTVCAILSFVLPSTFHLKLMGSSLKLWQRLLDYIILSIGLVFAWYSTYASMTGHSIGP